MRHPWLWGAAGVALFFLQPAEASSLGDPCACCAPAVTLTQATPSARTPASLTVQVQGQRLRLEADTIEGALDDGPIEATGDVLATFRDVRLRADHLFFDRQTGEGLATGSVVISRPPYQLRAEALSFNLTANTGQAVRWQGRIEGALQAQGRLIQLDATRSVAFDTAITPCLAEDPGYRFEFARLEWEPQPEGDSLVGRDAILRVSGMPVFWLPYFQSTARQDEDDNGPQLQIQSQLQAGYDAFDGYYLTTSGDYELAPGWTGRVPVRATTQRGLTVGVEQRLPLEAAEGRFDAFYTAPFPGDPASSTAFFPGPRANLSLLRDLPGGVGIMSVGYRVEVNNPFRIGPFPALSNQPVSRLPEFTYQGAPRELGPIRLTPSARAGYLIEEGGASSPLTELALFGSGPDWWLPGGIRLSPYGSLRGNVYRALSPNELMAAEGFLGRLARGVGQLGVSASTEWLGFQLGGSAETVRLLSSTPTDFEGTPFTFDVILPQDRLVASARRHVYGPWSLGMDAVVVQPYGPQGSLGWRPADLGMTLGFQVNCLSAQFSYRPLIQGFGFSYLVTTF